MPTPRQIPRRKSRGATGVWSKADFLDILRASPDERRALYATAAARLGIRAENIEKDLNVCWILDFLFNRKPKDGVRLNSKAGTSLSKAFGLSVAISPGSASGHEKPSGL